MSENSLSAREKGDIYWRKLKYYLNAVENKQKDAASGTKGKNIAKEILALDSGVLLEGIKNGSISISGNEFKLRPPTATGERLHKYSILLVMKSRDHYSEILANANFSEADKDIKEQLKKLVKVMDEVTTLWFASKGVDASGAKVDKGLREEAESKLDKSIKTYENTVKSFRSDVAQMIIERLMKEIPQSPEEEDYSYFTKLIEDNPGNYRLHKSKITRALEEYKVLNKKRLENTGDIRLVEKLIEKKGRYTVVNSIMTLGDALAEYKDRMDIQMSAVYWAELACKSLAEAFLTDEPADPMVANYIKSHWDADVPSYPVLQMAGALPGYHEAESPDNYVSEYSYDTFEEILEAEKELIAYREEHFECFQFQTIKTILFGSEDMPETGGKARALRNSIAKFTVEGKTAGFDDEDMRKLEDAWLTADTISRVAYLMVDYRNSSKNRVLRDMIESFPNDAYELNYTMQERRCRECMEKFIQLKG